MPVPDNFKVNFFLAGFPKCGTTAVAGYLAQHPNICFSAIKEPFFFCTDFPKRQVIKSWNAYRKLFHPTAQTKVFGEGTVCYVYSKEALNGIKRHNPNAKLIFMVRNPVDLAYSLHANQLRVFDEDVESFEEAWNRQASRRGGENIPKLCAEPFFLQYKEVASQGAYLERVCRQFPAEQILVLFFDDLKKSPESVYRQVLKFLDLDIPAAMPSFESANENLSYKSGSRGFIGRTLRKLSKNQTLVRLKTAMGIGNLNTEKLIRNMSMEKAEREELPHALRAALILAFENDIKLLERITQRDLSAWRVK